MGLHLHMGSEFIYSSYLESKNRTCSLGCLLLFCHLSRLSASFYPPIPQLSISSLSARVHCLWLERIIWKINCNLLYCGYCQQPRWTVQKEKEGEIRSKFNKGAVNRLGLRMKKKENKRWSRRQEEMEGIQRRRERCREEKREKVEKSERRGQRNKGGVWQESVQKMELEATVALLYLDGKIRI